MKETIKPLYFIIRSLALRLIPSRRAVPSLPRNGIRSILVLRFDRTGDLVLTTGIFRTLRKNFPGARITALVPPRNADILRHNPHIDTVVEYAGLLDALKRLRGVHDLVIDPLMNYTLFSALLSRLLRPAFSVGFDIRGRGKFFTAPVPYRGERRHFVDHLYDLLIPLGIDPAREDRSPELYVPETARREAQSWCEEIGVAFGSPYISLHPGGFYPSQRWHRDKYGLLVRRLLERHPRAVVLVFGIAAERGIIAHIRQAQEPAVQPRVVAVIDQPLARIIALMKGSQLFIGNNSGLVHIAAALRVPTVSVMGPTVPWLWRPYGDAGKNIVVRRELPCSPCGKGVCPGHACMESIPVDELFDKAEGLLKQNAQGGAPHGRPSQA